MVESSYSILNSEQCCINVWNVGVFHLLCPKWNGKAIDSPTRNRSRRHYSYPWFWFGWLWELCMKTFRCPSFEFFALSGYHDVTDGILVIEKMGTGTFRRTILKNFLLISTILVFRFNFTLNCFSLSISLYGMFFLCISSRILLNSSNWFSGNTRVRVLNGFLHTVEENIYKDWMNEKRTKKYFHIHNNDNERRIWVRLPDGKNEEEVELLNLMIDETVEFNEVAKKYILNGMRDYPQCFITSWHTTSYGHSMENSINSISPMVDWDTFVSSTRITSIIE